MNQTTSEYLTAEYGEAQATIQLELDWMESVIADFPFLNIELNSSICTECEGCNWITLPDGSTQCGNCD
jgi:hypothetical protein